MHKLLCGTGGAAGVLLSALLVVMVLPARAQECGPAPKRPAFQGSAPQECSPGFAAGSVRRSSRNTPDPSPEALRFQWIHAIYGWQIGMAGLFCQDLDGDGREEILAGTSSMGDWWNDYWYVLRYEPSDGTLQRLFTGPFDPSTVVRILVVPNPLGPENEIWVVSWSGRWDIYSGKTFGLLRSGWLPFSPNDAALLDKDGDGREELVATSESVTGIFRGDTFEPLLILPVGGRVMAAGHFGPANHPGVALGGSESGVVLDLRTGDTLFSSPAPMGKTLLAADFDGDGLDEVIGDGTGAALQGFDPLDGRIAWEVPREEGTEALDLVDITGDGAPEIVFADWGWGDIYAMDLRTRAISWTIPNDKAWGMIRMACGDLDGDGKRDLIRSIRGAWNDEVPFLLGRLPFAETFWTTRRMEGPFSLAATGDVDGDGRKEVIFVSYMTAGLYSPSAELIFDAASGELKKTIWEDYGAIWDMVLADVNGDGRKDLVFAMENGYSGHIRARDGLTGEILLDLWPPEWDGEPAYKLKVADVDLDGQEELVIGTGAYSTASQGGNVFVYGLDGARKWASYTFDFLAFSQIFDLQVADVDGDGHPEILALISSIGYWEGWIVTFDGVTHAKKMEMHIDDPTYHGFLADLDGDGLQEYLNCGWGVVQAVDPRTGTLLWRRNIDESTLFLRAVNLLPGRVSDLVANVRGSVAFCSGWDLQPYAVSEPLAYGIYPPADPEDVDGDGALEMAVPALHDGGLLRLGFMADGVADLRSGDAPLAVHFTSRLRGGTPPYVYTWDFGDGSASQPGSAVDHTYLRRGNYRASLTVADAEGKSATDGNIFIHALSPCVLACHTDVPEHGNVWQPISCRAWADTLSCEDPVAYEWDFGDGSQISQEQYPVHSYYGPASWTWTLTARGDDGKSCSASGTIHLATPPRPERLLKKGNPFRLRVVGSLFQSDCKVTVAGVSWPQITFVSPEELLLSGGAKLKKLVPRDRDVLFRFENGDGGWAEVTLRWH